MDELTFLLFLCRNKHLSWTKFTKSLSNRSDLDSLHLFANRVTQLYIGRIECIRFFWCLWLQCMKRMPKTLFKAWCKFALKKPSVLVLPQTYFLHLKTACDFLSSIITLYLCVSVSHFGKGCEWRERQVKWRELRLITQFGGNYHLGSVYRPSQSCCFTGFKFADDSSTLVVCEIQSFSCSAVGLCICFCFLVQNIPEFSGN